MGASANLLFIIFFIAIFYENPHRYQQGFVLALAAGFLFDAVSLYYFGTSIIVLLITYAAFKLTTHFLKDMHEQYVFAYFVPLLLLFLTGYNSLMYAVTHFPHVTFNPVNEHVFMALAYNLIVGTIFFYFYHTFFMGRRKDRQLRLF